MQNMYTIVITSLLLLHVANHAYEWKEIHVRRVLVVCHQLKTTIIMTSSEFWLDILTCQSKKYTESSCLFVKLLAFCFCVNTPAKNYCCISWCKHKSEQSWCLVDYLLFIEWIFLMALVIEPLLNFQKRSHDQVSWTISCYFKQLSIHKGNRICLRNQICLSGNRPWQQ